MPFAKKQDALMKNGKLKRGFREITGKDGKIRYMSEKPAAKPIVRNLDKALKAAEDKKKATVKKKSSTAVGNVKKSTPKRARPVSKEEMQKSVKEPKTVKTVVSKKKQVSSKDVSPVDSEELIAQ